MVQEAIDRLMASRTTLVIAHRLSTVAGADMIAVLSNGRIVEHGRHEDLLAAGGLYAQLVKRQMHHRLRLPKGEAEGDVADAFKRRHDL